MSAIDSHAENQGTPEAIDPENENLPVGKIAAVALVSFTCFALGILWAVQIMRGTVDDTRREFGPEPKAEALGRPEIGIVDQKLYQTEVRAWDLTQQKLQKLDQYGWVSRKDQLIHIPITEAMKAIAAGKRPTATPTGGLSGQPGPVQLGGDPAGVSIPGTPAMGAMIGAGSFVPGVAGGMPSGQTTVPAGPTMTTPMQPTGPFGPVNPQGPSQPAQPGQGGAGAQQPQVP